MTQSKPLPPEQEPLFYEPSDRESLAAMNLADTIRRCITPRDRQALHEVQRKAGPGYVSGFIAHPHRL